MKVAIPINKDKESVCVSFGRTPLFMFFDTEKQVSEVVSNPAANATGAAGIQSAQFLVDNKIEAVLTPRCGENAVKVLSAANVSMYQTTNENISMQIDLFLHEKLSGLNNVHAGFHAHGFKQ